ncbi:unnamed protein product [Urochloa decumbens]|uniref:Uncharacterized protein n=1 Tax=Urochloa decumbens TaxID=240449 RepID=A0ABC8WTB2_9POAL
MAAEELVLFAQDDKTVSLAIIPAPTTPPAAPSETEAAPAPAEAATFRLVVEQSYRSGGGGGAAYETDTMEDVACRVPAAEIRAGAAAVDRAFEQLLAGLDHPTLRREVAVEARAAAARVRARCAEEGDRLGGAEFRLRIVFVDDPFDEEEEESEPEPEPGCEEEICSDLEFDEESWQRGRSDGGDWRHEHDDPAVLEDDGGGQFTARPFDGALAREGGPSDGALLLSGFEARADGPELGDQHELTPRDVQRLVRLAVSGGDVEDDEGYQRVVDAGAPVSRAARAVMLDQGLRSTRPRQQQQEQSASTRGMPPRMRTGL